MRISTHHITCLLASIMALVSCSSDDELAGGDAAYTYGDTVSVTLSLGVQDAGGSTRADDTTSPTQKEGVAGENMYSWFVVAVKSSDNTVAAIANGTCTDSKQENVDMTLAAGTYDFYSFANLTQSEVFGESLTTGVDITTILPETFAVNGNGFDISTNHIPMSNVQEDVDVSSSGTVELWVVRMLAKMELDITNSSGVAVTVNSVTLSSVTQNPSSLATTANNLMLLPKQTASDGTGYCSPNLSNGAVKADYTYTISGGLTIADGETGTVTFYVNESEIATDATVPYFVITLNTTQSDTTTTTTSRYGVLTWNQIARNDWRVIPINLLDYKLEIIPYDFTAIGVYPASVMEENGVYTITFHAAGHFHLVPTVTKLSTGETLDYVASTSLTVDQWTMTDWTAGTETIYSTSANTESGASLFESSDDTSDASDNGGTPVWDSSRNYFFGKFAEGQYGVAPYTLKTSVGIDTDASDNVVTREYTYTVYLIRPAADED